MRTRRTIVPRANAGMVCGVTELPPDVDTLTVRSHPGTRAVPSWAILAVACLGQFMVILDVSIVNVALPSIRHDLDFSETGLQWVVNSYTIVFAGFLLLGGRAADLFGQRRLFLLGLGLFTGASLVGGFAQSQGMLIAARAAQGLGGAVLSPATLTIITTTFREPAVRARALGAWSAVAGAGGAAGALAGGILTDLISWRWILFVNVPIGAVGLIVARLLLTETRNEDAPRRMDFVGAVLVTCGLTAFVWGLVDTDTHGWGSVSALAPILVGVVLLAVFMFYESRVKAPLVPLRLFRSRSVSAANAAMFCISVAIFPSWYFLSLYVQNSLGYSPLVAGLVFLPQTFTIIVGAQVGSRVIARFGVRALVAAGGLISSVGLFWLGQIPVTGSYIHNLMLPSILTALGLGVAVTPITLAATTGVARSDAGLASGVVNTTRQVGGSIGLAALVTLAANHTRSLRNEGQAAASALVAGYGRALEAAAVLALLGALAALALPPLGRRGGPADVADRTDSGTAGGASTGERPASVAPGTVSRPG